MVAGSQWIYKAVGAHVLVEVDDEVGDCKDVGVGFHVGDGVWIQSFFENSDKGGINVAMHVVGLLVLLSLDFGCLDGGAVEVDEVGCFARIERCNVWNVADCVVDCLQFDEV